MTIAGTASDGFGEIAGQLAGPFDVGAHLSESATSRDAIRHGGSVTD